MRLIPFLTAALVTLAAADADAALVPMDSEFGTGTIIRDADNGLDWLKLTVTRNMSTSEIEVALAPGGAFAGFRYATTAEMCAMGTAFFGAADCGGYNANPDLDMERTKEFVALFGPTFAVEDAAFVRGNFEPRPGDDMIMGTHLGWNPFYAFSDTQGLTYPRNAYAEEGHYLVRAIPEPVGLGVLMLLAAVLTMKRPLRR